MKRLFTLSVILVATGILMPSCGTHMKIVKRQHSKGYYVDISSDRKSSREKAESLDLKTAEENQLATESPKKVKPSKVEPVHIVKSLEETEAVAVTENVEVEENGIAVAEKKAVEKKATVQTVKSLVKVEKNADSKISKSNLKSEIKKFSEIKQGKKMESKQVASGLSLFWIVVLILLLLWALGLIGGLGWFIHLVLVAALICLILWLLGVV